MVHVSVVARISDFVFVLRYEILEVMFSVLRYVERGVYR